MGHWYDKDGNPQHSLGKNGTSTTLRHARIRAKEGNPIYPSVTTIGGIMHKEGLVRWLQEEAAMMAARIVWGDLLGSEQGTELHKTDYINRFWARGAIAKAKAETTKKADIGTDIHDVLERFHEDPFSVTGDDAKMCFAIEECIKENTGLSLYEHFTPEARFCDTQEGYAGMCDLHTKYNGCFISDGEESHEPRWVIDYKTKDEVNEKTKGYEEQAEQLAAYAHGLGIPDARTGNIFISRNPPPEGEPWGVKFFEHKDVMAWYRFKYTLMRWQIGKKFGPYYETLKGTMK